jgi:sec-independent protein translocase protein TatB
VFNLQGSEIIFILLLALVVLGPEKLPSAIRRFTQTYAELRKMGTGFQSELKSALDEPMREMKETAGLLRDAADPAKTIADAERDAERKLRAQQILDRDRPERMQNAEDAGNADTADAGETAAPADADVVADAPDVVDEWADPIDLDDTATPADDPATPADDDEAAAS